MTRRYDTFALYLVCAFALAVLLVMMYAPTPVVDPVVVPSASPTVTASPTTAPSAVPTPSATPSTAPSAAPTPAPTAPATDVE